MASMDDLRVLAREIHDANDQLNRIILQTENELTALNLGVEAWVADPVKTGDAWKEGSDNCRELTYLGWMKYSGTWCLMFKTMVRRERMVNQKKVRPPFHINLADDEYISVPVEQLEMKGLKPVGDSSRSMRVLAAKHLPDLFRAIHLEARKVLEAVAIHPTAEKGA